METLPYDERNYQRAASIVQVYSKGKKMRRKHDLLIYIHGALNQASQDDHDSDLILLEIENRRLRKNKKTLRRIIMRMLHHAIHK